MGLRALRNKRAASFDLYGGPVKRNRKAQIRIPIPFRALSRLAGVLNRVDSISAGVPWRMVMESSELGLGSGVEVSQFLPLGLTDILRKGGRPLKPKLSSEVWYILTEAILAHLFGVGGKPGITLHNLILKTIPDPFTAEGTPERVHTLLLRAIRYYAGKDLAARIKRCQHCNRWFADITRNRSKLRCSQKCTSRTWNRAKRREASHKQYRKKAHRQPGRVPGLSPREG